MIPGGGKVVTTQSFLADLTPGGVLFVSMPGFRDEELDKRIKAIPGRHWSSANQRWEWGWSPEVAVRLRELGIALSFSALTALDYAADRVRLGPNEPTRIFRTFEEMELEWRAGTEPREHQRAFKAWRRGAGADGLLHTGALLEAGKGLGKTLSAIEEILEQLHHKQNARILVLARNSNLYDPWCIQFEQHAEMGDESVYLLNGKRKDRLAFLEYINAKSHGPWIVLHNHEDMPAMGEALASVSWDMIVLDESSRFRTANAARVKRMTGASAKKLDAPNKIALSGGPMIKHATDLYPVMKWLGAPVGSKADFVERFVITGGFSGTEEIAIKDVAGLNQLLDCYRFVVPKGSVLNLPRAWHRNYVELKPWQRATYKRIQKDLRSRFVEPDGTIQERRVLNRLGEILRLAQVAAGFEAIDTEHFNWRDDNAKTEELFTNVLPDFKGEQVLLWCHYQAEVENLARLAYEHGWEARTFYGGNSDGLNNQYLAEFKAGKADLFILNTLKGAHGLNLPMAHTAIYYTRTFDTEAWEQSLERNSRLDTVLEAGETLNVIIIEATDTVDERIDVVLGDDVRQAAQVTSVDIKAILGIDA